ncbi:MAG: hypothetical protein EXS08_07965 [Planctomycetes bacterium]|nr:hypothetical protein [Planctomycetota bacterium]
MPSLFAACCLALAPLLLPQEPPVQGVGSAEARALWQRVCGASGNAAREPIRAFQLRAEVLTRSGVGSNEGTIDYAYMEPDCIRFVLPNKKETGRFGPAPEQYWLKDGKEVVALAGREYKEDRRAVDDMLSLARNYVALSNPVRLNLVALELPPAPPADLGPELARLFKKLTWLALESPDFALVRRTDAAAKSGTIYRVELGLNESALPSVAIIRERDKGGADPLLVEFSKYEEHDSFKIPLVLLVRVIERTQPAPVFASAPAQEVYVKTAALRPKLTVADFQPKK